MAAKKEKKAPKGETTLKDTLKEIRSKFGEDAIMTLADTPHVDVDVIPTGSMGIDLAVGIGGLPRGRVVEIFGPESSGKTTLALHVIAEAQKMGEVCVFIDAEQAMDPMYAQKLGVNIDDLLISQPGSGEEALQIVDELVRGGKVGVIVIDSVAALTPQSVIEGDIGDIKVAALARLMSQSLGKLINVVKKSKTLVIFTNQIRMTMMTFGGANPETTSGGKALKFYASVRLDIRRIATIKKGEEAVGSRVKVKVVKNKVGAPFKQTEFDILYNEGISPEGEIIALGEKYGLIKKDGQMYVYGEDKMGRGYDASRRFLQENPEIRDEIASHILIRAKE